jgi:exosortase E/protease (VPEID-CTERM system)
VLPINSAGLVSLGLMLLALVVEVLWLSVRFDAQALVDNPLWIARAIGSAPHAERLLISIVAATALLGLRSAAQAINQFSARVHQPIRMALFAGHVVALLVFVWLSVTVFGARFVNVDNGSTWALAWITSGALTLIAWALALAPSRAWIWAANQSRSLLVKTVPLGATIWAAGFLTQHLWASLAKYTFYSVEWMLSLMYPVVVSNTSKLIVGTPAFKVAISQQCSGLEGIGLIVAFLSVYLWLCRRELHFPAAFTLLPLGAVAVWVLNGVRIVALIVLGSSGWREVALGGFHSQAGWLTFSGLGLAMVGVTLQTGWFASPALRSSAKKNHDSVRHDLTTPYLLPFMTLLAAGMMIGAVSATFEWLYPLSLVGVAVVLWIYRRSYLDLTWTLSVPAAAIGVTVFAIWIVLAPDGANDKSAWPQALASIPSHWAAAWLLTRVLGFVIFVPFAEELAFRGFLARRVINPEFQSVPMGTFTWPSLVLSSLLFGGMHGQFWLAGTAAGVLFALAMYRRGSLGDAVQAHAIANGLIALYVLTTGRWSVWS